MPLRRTNHFWI